MCITGLAFSAISAPTSSSLMPHGPCHVIAVRQVKRPDGWDKMMQLPLIPPAPALHLRSRSALLGLQPLHARALVAPGVSHSRWVHVSAEEADSGGRHQHYMTQPKGRLQKGMRHRTDIPTGGPPSSGLEAGMTPAASIWRSTTMPQRWCIRQGSDGHCCACPVLRKALCMSTCDMRKA